MARLYTNENFPLPSAAALRRLGHDVVTTHDVEQSNRGVADGDVMAFAIEQQRAVVTLNRRHFVRLHGVQPGHAGIVVCTFDPDFEALAERIHQAVTAIGPLAGQLIRVSRPPS